MGATAQALPNPIPFKHCIFLQISEPPSLPSSSGMHRRQDSLLTFFGGVNFAWELTTMAPGPGVGAGGRQTLPAEKRGRRERSLSPQSRHLTVWRRKRKRKTSGKAGRGKLFVPSPPPPSLYPSLPHLLLTPIYDLISHLSSLLSISLSSIIYLLSYLIILWAAAFFNWRS